jgi:hypothetical protein
MLFAVRARSSCGPKRCPEMPRECGRNAQEMDSYRDISGSSRRSQAERHPIPQHRTATCGFPATPCSYNGIGVPFVLEVKSCFGVDKIESNASFDTPHSEKGKLWRFGGPHFY